MVINILPRALVAHPGTQYSFTLAGELAKRGLLYRFWTGMAVIRNGLLDRALRACGGPIERSIANRRLGNVSKSLVRTLPLLEINAWITTRMGGSAEDAFHRRNAAFQRRIEEADLQRADVIIGFDTSSWILARRCRKLGKAFILDQSIGHPICKEQIYQTLRRRFPSWATGTPRKRASHSAEEYLEHELASIIVVPSRFTLETLVHAGVSPSRIRVIPFGTDLTLFHPAASRPPSEPLVFLFVGSINARKGIPVLLAAWRHAHLHRAELWIAGPGEMPRAEIAAGIPDSIHLLGPRSKSHVAILMRRAHIFVFPSFFEGLAQVQLEALASGLPVIATHESGGTDVVKEGITGTIVPAGDVDALVEALRRFANDIHSVCEMRARLLENRDQLSWSHYGDRWAALLKQVA